MTPTTNNEVKKTTALQPWPSYEEQMRQLMEEGWEDASVVLPPIPARPYCVDPEPIGEQISINSKGWALIGQTRRMYFGILGGIDAAVQAVKTLVTQKLSEIVLKRIDWLWPDRFARGKVSIIAGNPGLGKSQITVSMAAIITTGDKWPDCDTHAKLGSVLVLSAEDDSGDTLKPRMIVAGADLDRVHKMNAVRVQTGNNTSQRTFDLTQDLPVLAARLTELGDVAMVIIDPITAYLGDADSHKNADMRGLLAPLSELASQHNVAIVGVSHLNKSVGSEAMLRVTGSLAFVAAARAAYLVSEDHENKERRLFLPMKNNVGSDKNGLAYRIEEVLIPVPNEEPIRTSRIVWDSEPVATTANEALTEDPNRSAVDDAMDWLKEYLADGPVDSTQVQKDAKSVGIKGATLRRAQKKLHVKAKKDGMEGGWRWSLPGEDAQE